MPSRAAAREWSVLSFAAVTASLLRGAPPNIKGKNERARNNLLLFACY
jgi:hypothetical protein